VSDDFRVVITRPSKRARLTVRGDTIEREFAFADAVGTWEPWEPGTVCIAGDLAPGLRQRFWDVGESEASIEIETVPSEREIALAKLTPRERELLGVS
jgi:hypothetical protein